MHDDADLPSKWAKEDTAHLDVVHLNNALVQLDEPYIIYNDRRKAIAKLNKRMMFAAPLVGIYCLMTASMHMYILSGVLFFWYVGMYLLVVRRFNKNVEPLMQIDSTGVKVHGLVTHCQISWDNFEEAAPYSFIYKFVGINPKSINRLNASLPMKLFLSLNGASRMFYRLLGVKLYVINVPEQYSHFKAEEICEEIEKRRQYFLKSSGNSMLPELSNNDPNSLSIDDLKSRSNDHAKPLSDDQPQQISNNDPSLAELSDSDSKSPELSAGNSNSPEPSNDRPAMRLINPDER